MIFRIALIILVFCILTALTQVGGVVLLMSLLIWIPIRKKANRLVRVIVSVSLFVALYSLSTFIVVPTAARAFDRVPLPIFQSNNIRPLNIWTCLLNRHYVKPELRDVVIEVARKMSEKYPGTVVRYLDANFPLIDRFPLPPHLGHNNGRKLDIAFYYTDSQSGLPSNESPSFMGYGVCEGPVDGEENMPAACASQGYWKYGILESIVPQRKKSSLQFDGERTAALVRSFAQQPSVSRMFIEPHLRQRLQLTSEKIRFHGCRAVRHDDHLHVQIN
ncbi:MAG TPA: hypothetical protein VK508_05155 [Cyclobacteriaceae bacterium]|nr:hypothetical protein [Cyclobacteriaceae bacterium]